MNNQKNYYYLYCKYKNKYLSLKNIIGGSTYIPPYLRSEEERKHVSELRGKKEQIVVKEITGDLTEYEKGTFYKFSGIISCVGLIITGINEDEKYGLGIHIVNSDSDGHFDDGKFTEKGEAMKTNILEKINSWPSGTNLEIKFYKVPLLNSIKFHSDTIEIINQLKILFNQNYEGRINKCEEIISTSCFNVKF